MVCVPSKKADADKKEEPKDDEEAVEKPEDEKKADDATKGAEAATEAAKPQDEAVNAGETPEAAKADAKPTDEEAKSIVLSKDIVDLLPQLKAAGAIREAKEGETPLAIPKAIADIMVTLTAAAMAESKRAEDLQAKLDSTPEKKVIGTRSTAMPSDEEAQANDGKATEAKAKQPSAWFKKLFQS